MPQKLSRMAESSFSASADKAQLFIAEGDTCFRQKLFEKAIMAYTNSLSYSQDKSVLINRSKCYVAIGNTERAIEDAQAAIKLAGSDFYPAYFQKGESYFAAGEFEEALACYYNAYLKRRDIKQYKLGVQKAEEAILKALASSIPYDLSYEPEDQEMILSIENLDDLLQSPPVERNEANRCLCGCFNCSCETCRDLYVNETRTQHNLLNGEIEQSLVKENSCQCACRCPSCIKHLAELHGLLSDAITGEAVEIDDVLGNNQSRTSTATPAAAMDEKLQELQLINKDSQAKKKVQKLQSNPMEEDLRLLKELQGDQTCKVVSNDAQRGISFIENRNEFWRQQGGNRKLNSHKEERTRCYKVDRTIAASQKLAGESNKSKKIEFEKYPTELDRIKLIIAGEEYEEANEQLEFLEAELYDQKSEIAKRLLSDIYVMQGCCLFELSNYGDALTKFTQSHATASDLEDTIGMIRAMRCEIRTYIQISQISAALQEADSCLARLGAYKVAQWRFLRCLIMFSICFCQQELKMDLQAKQSMMQLLTLMQDDDQPHNEPSCKLKNDSASYFSEAPVFFKDLDPSPEQLYEDTLCMAGSLDLYERGEEYLLSLKRFSEQVNDLEARKAALQNLAYYYKKKGELEKMKDALNELDVKQEETLKDQILDNI